MSKMMVGAVTVGAGVYTFSQSYASADSKGSVDWNAVKAEILKVYEEDENLGPFIVRLAWHASGTYDKVSKTGGSCGATMRFEPEIKHAANAGLADAQKLLEPIKAKFPGMSYADLWTYAAVVVIEAMGGPSIPWRSGRTDATSGDQCTPDGRLPDADGGSPKATVAHIRKIFYRMGFNDREIVALAGAHALGRCHPDRSGYDGPWTRAPTTFSNEFFKLLLNEHWTIRNWEGPQQWQNDQQDLMMLPADMAFTWDPEFLKYVRLYAQDEKIFFEDFKKAFQKLEELGVDFNKIAAANKPWYQFW